MSKIEQHPILETQDLSIGYASKKQIQTIASSITIKLKKGELIGLVGRNGIGKSTLLKTLTQVQEPLSGHIRLHNVALQNYSALSLAKEMSLVLTETLASKNLSVFELVALGRQPYTNWMGTLHDNDIAMTNRAIALVGITHLKHNRCFELSDGQLQNVMIARALAQDTSIIILDEPTSHLDLYHKALIFKLLKKLAKETGKTILFSSHDIDLAIQLCDTMIVMTADAVVTDTPHKLIEKGIFNTLFPEDIITFDTEKKSFKIKA